MRTEKGERRTLADREMTWVGKTPVLLLPPGGPSNLGQVASCPEPQFGPLVYGVCVHRCLRDAWTCVANTSETFCRLALYHLEQPKLPKILTFQKAIKALKK